MTTDTTPHGRPPRLSLAVTCGVLAALLAATAARARAAEASGEPPATDAAPGAASGADVEGPMRPDAGALYTDGLRRFGARDYAGAAADLEAGYALDARREFLFAAGQAKRLAGDCRGAVPLYQRFLDSKPPMLQVDATRIALARCAQQLAVRPDVVVTAPPPAAPPITTPWWRDPFGLAFAAAGVAGLGVGAGFLAASLSALDDADHAQTYTDYVSHRSAARTRLDVAVVAFVAATALAAEGARRLIIARRRAGAVALWLGPGTLVLGGAF